MENHYISLFRSVVLNTPLKNEIPLIVKEYTQSSFWEFLLWNRLVPLMYHTIKAQNMEEALPEPFMARLKIQHQNSIFRSLQMEGVIKEVITLLREENIHPYLLKGIALAFTVYENPALRPMLDIDLLFDSGHEIQARSILTGKSAKETYAEESRHTMGLWQHIPPLQYKEVIIELHSHILARYDQGFIPKKVLFENPITAYIGKIKCRTLSHEMQLYHLLVHMHKHVRSNYSRLIWLADLHLYISKYQNETDWEKIMFLAKEAKLDESFLLYLGIVNKILGTKIPLPLPDISNKHINDFMQLCRKIVPGETTIGTMAMMHKLSGNKEKALFIAGKLFPTLRYMKMKYGTKSTVGTFMYYPVLYWEYAWKWMKIPKRPHSKSLPHCSA